MFLHHRFEFCISQQTLRVRTIHSPLIQVLDLTSVRVYPGLKPIIVQSYPKLKKLYLAKSIDICSGERSVELFTIFANL